MDYKSKVKCEALIWGFLRNSSVESGTVTFLCDVVKDRAFMP